jgi:hypothetical protein
MSSQPQLVPTDRFVWSSRNPRSYEADTWWAR